MSWKATAFIKPITHFPDGTKLRASEKLLLFVLADDHNESRGYAWPSQKTLARNALLSERQVRRILQHILSKGWPIRVESQPKTGRFEMGSSHYYFIFPHEDNTSVPGPDISEKVRTQLRPLGADTATSGEVAVNRHLEPIKIRRETRAARDRIDQIIEERRRREAEARREAMVGDAGR